MSSEQPIRESRLTNEEAIAWAEEYYRQTGRWPRRRWRVEGTPVGNSRLLTEKAARKTLWDLKTRNKGGGSVVELIMDPKSYREFCAQTERKCVMEKKK